MTDQREIQHHFDVSTRLRKGLQALQRALSPRSRSRAWVDELGRVGTELAELNRQTEASFLAVGSNLMSFLTASRQLHSDISGFTSLITGEQVQQACDTLIAIRGHVQQTQRRSEIGSRGLKTLQASAGRIHRGFSTLASIALSFRLTATLARIETARLLSFEQDLGGLADDVSACSDGIQSRAEQVVEVAVAFNERIASTLGEVTRLDAIQQRELPAVLAAVDADLEQFETRRRRAGEASAQLARDLSAVSHDLGQITMAIQFHDITRQQVEHVMETLAELPVRCPLGALQPLDAPLIKLQRAQLESAQASFTASTRKIDEDLEGIADRVAEMAAASKVILGLDHESSFLDEMGDRLNWILRAINESQALEQTTAQVTADLEGLSHQLRASVVEVQDVELQLSRIAINTAIAACHIGAPGEPLSVVAAAMKTLQTECALRSREAETDLDLIGQAISSVSTLESGTPADNLQVLAGLETRMNNLRAANASSKQAADHVADLAGELGAALQKARDHSGIGQVFTETVERCCASLEAVAQGAHALWWAPIPSPDHSVAARYTMQAERDVHLAITGEIVGAPPPADPNLPPVANDEEIEFF